LDYKSGNIDLHIHSTVSDGSLAPLDILQLAEQTGLSAISLTDHDAIDGVREIASALGVPPASHTLSFLRDAGNLSPFFISGVEISAAPPPDIAVSGSFHILGYGFDPDDPFLDEALIRQQAARKNRNPHIISRLNDMGMDISLDEVASASGAPRIGRPHIAALMVEKGYVRNIDDAFDHYIGKGKPAYVDKPRIPAEDAIALIRSAGGAAVLAHPGLLTFPAGSHLDQLITALKEMGLSGLETYYPGHSRTQFAMFSELARAHGLLVTGGTDFHGAVTPGIAMGTGRGDFRVPFRIFEDLISHISGNTAPSPRQ
jgi:3',5'-nucleoside bisphosphate phosphatase